MQISFPSPIKDATLYTKLVKSNLVSFNIVSIVNAQCLMKLLEVSCGIRVYWKCNGHAMIHVTVQQMVCRSRKEDLVYRFNHCSTYGANFLELFCTAPTTYYMTTRLKNCVSVGIVTNLAVPINRSFSHFQVFHVWNMQVLGLVYLWNQRLSHSTNTINVKLQLEV